MYSSLKPHDGSEPSATSDPVNLTDPIFWPSQSQSMDAVHLHTCGQNTETY